MEELSFATAGERNFQQLATKIGQVFFIGDGLDDDSKFQKLLIPANAKTLYLGTMDGMEWNNNAGELSVSIFSEVK